MIFEEEAYTFVLKVPYSASFLYESGFSQVEKEWLPRERAWRLWEEDFYPVLELVRRYF